MVSCCEFVSSDKVLEKLTDISETVVLELALTSFDTTKKKIKSNEIRILQTQAAN